MPGFEGREEVDLLSYYTNGLGSNYVGHVLTDESLYVSLVFPYSSKLISSRYLILSEICKISFIIPLL